MLLLLVAPPKPDLQTAVDKLLAREKDFNGTVLVTRNGKTLYQRSLGLADRSLDVKVTAKTRFRDRLGDQGLSPPSWFSN